MAARIDENVEITSVSTYTESVCETSEVKVIKLRI